MRDVLETAQRIQHKLESHGWSFALIGGIANLAWGEVRSTSDVDITLLTGFTDEQNYVDAILSEFRGRIENAGAFALRQRVLLLTDVNDIGIDIGLGGFLFEELAVSRRVQHDYGRGIKLWIITAEDLIIMKAFASRDQDWVDIDGIIRRQHTKLDWDYIMPQVEALAEIKEDAEMVAKLLQKRTDSPE